MSNKVDPVKKQIAELQAPLEVEMATNVNGSNGTLRIDIEKKKTVE